MKPPFPSPTPTWHNDVYPAIDPTSPSLSHANQTIIVTGAGTGIGRETAIAFAASGAKHVVLMGRTEATLLETQKLIPSGSGKISVIVGDVTDQTSMEKAAGEIGTWDVLVLNAGYISPPVPAASAPMDAYWRNYEVNVKSIIIAAQAFFPNANKSRSCVLGVAAGGLIFPPKMTAGLSGYLCSKLAQIKTLEFLAAENENMFFCSVHPGMIETPMFLTSGSTPDTMPMDAAPLPAHFMVWVTQPEAEFLNGRFVFANWDVEELKGLAEEIQAKNQMMIGYNGWPFPHVG